MCRVEVFTYVYPNKETETKKIIIHCAEGLKGDETCSKGAHEYHHPPEYIRSGQTSSYHNQFPPTPPSSHSASDSERSSRRSHIYVNGEKVYEFSKPSRRNKEERERVTYSDEGSHSRSPPRYYDSYYSESLPSSPSRDGRDTYERRRRRDSIAEDRDRPTSSHVRPNIELKVHESPRKSHRRHESGSKTSSAKTSSSKASSQDDGEEERPRRRDRRNSTVRFEDEERQKKMQSEIDRQNEAIASRPARPVERPVEPPSRYRRGSVVVNRGEPLVKAMDQMSLDRHGSFARADKERRRIEREVDQWDRENAEAQRQRLKDRMAPKPRAPRAHRASVSVPMVPPRPSQHSYEDGLYRWD
ncbi:hypothetical protein F4779DRAFT_21768 [Xylariaceae sp. FL0662B]|nr:hypothetical protein F4779DRAFT_21768 [Xylariaceae sp. FL0662B]